MASGIDMAFMDWAYRNSGALLDYGGGMSDTSWRIDMELKQKNSSCHHIAKRFFL
jgi:hypothetical protein